MVGLLVAFGFGFSFGFGSIFYQVGWFVDLSFSLFVGLAVACLFFTFIFFLGKSFDNITTALGD